MTDAAGDLGLSVDPVNAQRYSLAGGNPVSYAETDGHVATTSDQRSANVQVQGGDTYNRSSGTFTSGSMETRGPGANPYVDNYNPTASSKPWLAKRIATSPAATRVFGGSVSPEELERFNADVLLERLVEEILPVERRLYLESKSEPVDVGSALLEGALWISPCKVARPVCKKALSAGTGAAGKIARWIGWAGRRGGSGLSLGERAGMVREAFQGTGNFGIGYATRQESDELGRAFVGPGFTRSKSNSDILISADSLRVYRPPTYKKDLGTVQANLERRFEPGGPINSNAHLEISDP
jgi:hypothetical protein